MKTIIGITWIARLREYFPKSIKTVDHSDVIIYPDGQEFKFPTPFQVKNLGENVGCFKHYYRVLEDLCNTDADVVGVFADDILYKKGWIDKAVEKLQDESVGFVACYTPKGLAIRNKFKGGWNEINGGFASSWGGGYLMRKEVAAQVLTHHFILDHLENYSKNQQIDHAVPEAIHQMGLRQLFHVPSFIDHIGLKSTIGHKHQSWDRGVGW